MYFGLIGQLDHLNKVLIAGKIARLQKVGMGLTIKLCGSFYIIE